MNRRKKTIQRVILLFMVGTLLILTAGCGVRLFPAEIPISESGSRDRSLLHEAFQRFETGDFENASVIFEQLYKDAGDTDIRQTALYGLACSHLILAEDDGAMDKAIRFWNTWSQLEAEGLVGTDPRMLTPLIHRIVMNGFVEPQIAFFRSEDNQPASEEPDDIAPVDTLEVVVPETVAVVPEENTCEILLEDREKQIRQMEKNLNKMKRRIRKLKTQIESLENIHRIIQEKRENSIIREK